MNRTLRTLQIILTAVAVLAASAAILRHTGRGGPALFGERLEVVPSTGPVGIAPFLEFHGFGSEERKVYMCKNASGPVDDCAELGEWRGTERVRAKPVPPAFPSGDEVVPATYVVRVGPDDDGKLPVRARFRVVNFELGPRVKPLSFAAIDPSELKLGSPKVIAHGTECIPPPYLPDGRLSVGSTIFDPVTGVTIDLRAGASQLAWSPVGDKLAILTADHKEIRLAAPDGSDPVTQVREARGLLSSLSWSAEGDRLAFIAQNDPTTRLGPGPPTVRILNATNGQTTSAGAGLAVEWSPASDLLAVEMAGSVIEVGTPDGGRRKLVDGRLPSWSPDGRLLAFVKDDAAFVADSDGSQPVAVVKENVCAVSFSSAGNAMAVVENKGDERNLVLRPISRS